MDFNSPVASGIYGDRHVDAAWSAWCMVALSPAGKDVVDIGSGGGIYSMGFATLGAKSVTGIDRSAQYVEEARATHQHPAVQFNEGTATQTGLADACADIVFERAVIHHLDAQTQYANALEAKRLLRPQGLFCAQDRTLEDVQADDEAFWIRAALLRTFPRLLEVERGRRPERDGYAAVLEQAGLSVLPPMNYAEIRRSYDSFDELETEILARKGKSILFELSDAELRRYVDALREESRERPLVECDSWTIWLAIRPE